MARAEVPLRTPITLHEDLPYPHPTVLIALTTPSIHTLHLRHVLVLVNFDSNVHHASINQGAVPHQRVGRLNYVDWRDTDRFCNCNYTTNNV